MLDKDVLSPQEVAAFMGLSVNCVYDYIKNGTIPARRLPRADGTTTRRIFISKADILRLMEVEG